MFVQFYAFKNTSNNSVEAHLCSELDTDRDGVDCPYSKFILSVFWHVISKLTDTNQWSGASSSDWGSVATSPMRHDWWLQERQNFLRRDYASSKHLFDVNLPGHRDKQLLLNSRKELRQN